MKFGYKKTFASCFLIAIYCVTRIHTTISEDSITPLDYSISEPSISHQCKSSQLFVRSEITVLTVHSVNLISATVCCKTFARARKIIRRSYLKVRRVKIKSTFVDVNLEPLEMRNPIFAFATNEYHFVGFVDVSIVKRKKKTGKKMISREMRNTAVYMRIARDDPRVHRLQIRYDFPRNSDSQTR